MMLMLVTVTFLLAVFLTGRFSRPRTLMYIVHQPNARSLHTHPIPISGGVAILGAFFFSIILSSWFYPLNQIVWWICFSSLLIALISFIDDCQHVSVKYRLSVHFLAASVLLWRTDLWITALTLPGFTWEWPPFLQVSISLLFLVWMVNLYNFMDGMDGFAGGMTIFGFGGLAILGGLNGHFLFMTLNLIVISATAGFLVLNFPPAKIFMGDTGASSLGFLAAAFSLWGHHEGLFPLWIILLLFSPFIVDATVTLVRRLIKKERIWVAHKTHYYQRLVQIGWGHRRTVLWEYSLMLLSSGSAIIAPSLPIYGQRGLLIGWGFIYFLLIHLVHFLERRVP